MIIGERFRPRRGLRLEALNHSGVSVARHKLLEEEDGGALSSRRHARIHGENFPKGIAL